jgi:hypothetical protein
MHLTLKSLLLFVLSMPGPDVLPSAIFGCLFLLEGLAEKVWVWNDEKIFFKLVVLPLLFS